MKTEKEIMLKHSKIVKPCPNMERNLMRFGLGCRPGWFDLIDEVLTEIEKLNLPEDFEICQIKEKMGELRIYTSDNAEGIVREKIISIINHAEVKASVTCELCGSERGRLEYYNSWRIVLCEKCKRGL